GCGPASTLTVVRARFACRWTRSACHRTNGRVCSVCSAGLVVQALRLFQVFCLSSAWMQPLRKGGHGASRGATHGTRWKNRRVTHSNPESRRVKRRTLRYTHFMSVCGKRRARRSSPAAFQGLLPLLLARNAIL